MSRQSSPQSHNGSVHGGADSCQVGQSESAQSPAEPEVGKGKKPAAPRKQTIRLVGELPPESFNRVGTKLVPKLRAGEDLRLSIDFTVTVASEDADSMVEELRQILGDLNLGGKVRVEKE